MRRRMCACVCMSARAYLAHGPEFVIQALDMNIRKLGTWRRSITLPQHAQRPGLHPQYVHAASRAPCANCQW